MSKVLERVARAIDPKGWEAIEVYCRAKEYDAAERADCFARSIPIQRSLSQARAAIEAIREPTIDMMISAGEHTVGNCSIAAKVWRSMICDRQTLGKPALGEVSRVLGFTRQIDRIPIPGSSSYFNVVLAVFRRFSGAESLSSTPPSAEKWRVA